MACHIRRNDMVEVIAGDHRGERGKVLRIDLAKQRVVVEGVNLVYRHVRPTRRNPQGGRIRKEAPIHISNVLPVDSKLGRGSRTRIKITRDEQGRIQSKQCIGASGTVLHEMVPRLRGEGAAR